jgi:hypothetical protein
MAFLITTEIDYADEFDVYGFAVFKEEREAKDFIEKIVLLSRGDEEWCYFGSNEAIGNFSRKDFKIQELSLDDMFTLDKLFFNKGLDMVSYGIMNNIIMCERNP